MYSNLTELAEELKGLKKKYAEYVGDDDVILWPDDDSDVDFEDLERLEKLLDLEGQLFTDMESYAKNEATMIPEGDFEEYAENFAYEVGIVERDSSIVTYVDWERWASDLGEEYTKVNFDDEGYCIRSY